MAVDAIDLRAARELIGRLRDDYAALARADAALRAIDGIVKEISDARGALIAVKSDVAKLEARKGELAEQVKALEVSSEAEIAKIREQVGQKRQAINREITEMTDNYAKRKQELEAGFSETAAKRRVELSALEREVRDYETRLAKAKADLGQLRDHLAR